jgi:hypothetical protein
VLTQDALDRLRRPIVETGQHVSALRFGDLRVMARFQALCAFTHLPRGFRWTCVVRASRFAATRVAQCPLYVGACAFSEERQRRKTKYGCRPDQPLVGSVRQLSVAPL